MTLANTSTKARITKREKRELLTGLATASPWIIGFLFFSLIPLILSIGISLTNYSFLAEPKFVGLENYKKMLFDDPLIWHSLRITLVYAVLAVPEQLIVGFVLALLLNSGIKGLPFFRTVFYLPTLVVTVAASLLWKQMLDTDFGVINYVIKSLGGRSVRWLSGGSMIIIISFVIISMWGVGRSIIINLSGLQSIPTQLYEAAEIDGCSRFRRIFNITIPMMSPNIFLNLMTGLIGAFKSFTLAKIITDGGPNDQSLFYMLYLYRNGFISYRMGYASAMSWLLFVIVAFMTFLVFRSSNSWVHYDGGVR